MVTIDLAHTSVREANERIRRYGADGTDVELVNPDARHHLGVGLVHPINVRIRGSAGYFCAGLTDAARFEVDNNVGWGVGDNMYTGRVVVRGNAGAIPGVAIRGAEIVIHGNMGSRAGQVMKAGTLACAGHANFMAGYMMYGGRIIILGDSGEKVGEDMTGGHIFVGGKVQELGSDAERVDLDEGEDDDLRAFLDRYELRFTGTFTKIANAGKKLRYATSERQMRSIPFFTFSGASEYWNPKIQEDIYIKSQIGRYRIRGYGGARPLPHLADLGFRRDVSRAGKDADPVSKVALRDRDRRPERRQPPQALDAGDDRAHELRGAERIDQARGRPCLDPLGDRREHRRGRHERRAARGGEPAHLPDARRSARLEHPRHEPRRRPGDLHLPGREARPGRAAHGEEGHARACPHPRHSPRHRLCARRRATPTSSAATTSSSRSRRCARRPDTACP